MTDVQFEIILVSIIKIAAIIFAIAHFFVAFILFRQISRMRRVIKTSASEPVALLSFIHLLLLLIIIVLIFFVPIN